MTDARLASRLKRSGLRARDVHPGRIASDAPVRAVFCVPVLPDPSATFQWARELRRRGYRSTCAVQFRVPDTVPVYFGPYGAPLASGTAAEAVAAFRAARDARGLEVLVPRSIRPDEIVSVRPAPRLAGWRYYPGAHGRRPFWPAAGDIKAARVRARIDEEARSGR